jgi:diguanylate cyclase (GGDEF)-like protein
METPLLKYLITPGNQFNRICRRKDEGWRLAAAFSLQSQELDHKIFLRRDGEMSPEPGYRDILADTGQVERLLACIEFSKALVGIYDMEGLLTAILGQINDLIPAHNWSLLLLDPQTQELYFAVAVGVDPESVKGIRLKLGEGIAGVVAQEGRPIFVPDVDQDQRFTQRVDAATGFETRSIMALPLFVRGEVIGVFEVVNVENLDFFRERFIPLLTILADYVAIAVDNIRNFQKLQARAYIDDITGFYNTRYLLCKLDRHIPEVIKRGTRYSMAFLDLDNFKDIVDAYGHLLGSKVLAEVARVINTVLGPDDSLVRYGGDEFIILLPNLSQAEALELVRRMRRAINATAFLQEEGVNLHLTASYGIATLPEDAQDRETLLAIADRAMFTSKGRGKDCIMVGKDLIPAPV